MTSEKKSEVGSKTKAEPKISVIVPVFNLENEISKCIFSILLQKFQDFEVIVVDDGSTDSSLAVVSEIAKKYKQVQVFHTPNKGLSSARNFGIRKAKGELLAFVDGDDYLDPDYLSGLFKSIEKTGSDIAVSGFSEIDGEKISVFSRKEMAISGAEAVSKLLREQENIEIVSWNKLYRRKLFRGIRFPAGQNFEDNFTTYKLFSKAEKVSFVSSALYNYVRRSDSITGREEVVSRLSAKLSAAREAKEFFKTDAKLFSDAKFSEILAFFQFIDFSIRGEISKKYFKEYRERVLKKFKKEPEFFDSKRKLYTSLLRPLNGFFYKIFRKIKY